METRQVHKVIDAVIIGQKSSTCNFDKESEDQNIIKAPMPGTVIALPITTRAARKTRRSIW
jgi:hypothetical protein